MGSWTDDDEYESKVYRCPNCEQSMSHYDALDHICYTDEIQFSRLGTSAGREQWPARAYAGDAGWDLYVSEKVVIQPGAFADVPCGVACALPHGTWGLLTGRSSTLRSRGLLVHQGVIDEGYRGPLYAGVFNLGRHVALVEAGSRLAQLIVVPMHVHHARMVNDLRPGTRGTAGFGSSGV